MCCIISAVSTTCIISEFVEEKNRTCILQQAGDTKNSLSISISLSLSLSLSLKKKPELARVIYRTYV